MRVYRRHWLDHDSAACAVLVGIGVVELLALSFLISRSVGIFF